MSLNLVLFLVGLSSLSKALPSENHVKDGTADNWALLVAGSSTWMNYRHQADVCHAYQILRSHGIPDERIVVMMADDIAFNTANPTPGVIINKKGGPNVYENVPHDYTGMDVTVENFLNILLGNKTAMEGIGSGKVIDSGPNSFVFVNLVDHGAPGIFGFPFELLYADQLIGAIEQMHAGSKYARMVVYVEACESGSLFHGLLPPRTKVYATTAANPRESSYACYYDSTLETYLGDVFSVKWMENVDKRGTQETLRHQYYVVKEETTTSHVKHYGDLLLDLDKLSKFLGSENPSSHPTDQGKYDDQVASWEGAVPSGDVPIAVLANRIAAATDVQEKAQLELELHKELELRTAVRSTMHTIAAAFRPENVSSILETKALPRNFDCISTVVELFSQHCFKVAEVEYALRQVYVLVNLCELSDLKQERLEDAVRNACPSRESSAFAVL